MERYDPYINYHPATSEIPLALTQYYADLHSSQRSDHMGNPSSIYPGTGKFLTTRIAEIALQDNQNNKGSAIVLGAGNCLDTPVDFLVHSFDKVTLVDIQTDATVTALDAYQRQGRLSKEDLQKVDIVNADISLVAKDIYTAFQRSLRYGSPEAFQEEVQEEVREIIANVQAEPVADKQSELAQFLGTHGFVVSQFVMSELATPYDLGIAIAQKKYPAAASELGTLLSTEVFTKLDTAIQVAHIALLRQLVHDEGTVHFADAISGWSDAGSSVHVASKQALGVIKNFFDFPDPPMIWVLQAQNRTLVVDHSRLKPQQAADPASWQTDRALTSSPYYPPSVIPNCIINPGRPPRLTPTRHCRVFHRP